MGVDVFFVISGYLITKIILIDLEQEQFKIVNFYERRARRILPALFFVVFTLCSFCFLNTLTKCFGGFWAKFNSCSYFFVKCTFLSERGYFGGATELKPLIHTWSLAVEEQFYLIFPVILMLLWSRARRWIGISILLIIVSSLYVSWFLTGLHFETAFYLPFARAWELMVGAAAAFFAIQLSNFGTKYSNILSITGLLLVFYAIFYFDGNTSFPGFAAAVPVLGTSY